MRTKFMTVRLHPFFCLQCTSKIAAGVLDTLSSLRSRGTKVGGCSGYNDAIMAAVTEVSVWGLIG